MTAEPVDIVALTRSLVDIDSTTGREGECGRWLADYLRGRDWAVEEQRVDATRFNVIAAVAQGFSPAVVFSTHFDCVPSFFPSRVEGDKIFGRGSCDAKGILAAQVAAAEQLRREGETRVGLVFVVGEERGSDGARVANQAAPGAGARFLINGEPTDNRLGAGDARDPQAQTPRQRTSGPFVVPRARRVGDRQADRRADRAADAADAGRSGTRTDALHRRSDQRRRRSQRGVRRRRSRGHVPDDERCGGGAESSDAAGSTRRDRARARSAAGEDEGRRRFRHRGVSVYDGHPVPAGVGRAAAVRSGIDSRRTHRGRVGLDRGTARRRRIITSPWPKRCSCRRGLSANRQKICANHANTKNTKTHEENRIFFSRASCLRGQGTVSVGSRHERRNAEGLRYTRTVAPSPNTHSPAPSSRLPASTSQLAPSSQPPGPATEYDQRLAARNARIAELDRINLIISHARLAIALVGAVLLWMAFVRMSISPWWPLGGVAVVWRARRGSWQAAAGIRTRDGGGARVSARSRSAARRVAGHRPRRRGVSRGTSLRARSRSVRTGVAVRAAEHDAHRDRRADAGRLAARAGAAAEVRARQAAIDELRPMLDFKEDVAVLASESPVGRTGLLATWAASPPVRFAPALRIALAACALDHHRAGRRSSTATSPRRNGCSPGCLSRAAFAAIWRRPFHQVLHAHRNARARSRPARRAAGAYRTRALHVAASRQRCTRRLMTDGVPPSRRIAQLRRARLVARLDAQHDVRADRLRPAAAPAAGDGHRSLARGLRTGGRPLAARRRRRRGADRAGDICL